MLRARTTMIQPTVRAFALCGRPQASFADVAGHEDKCIDCRYMRSVFDDNENGMATLLESLFGASAGAP